MLSIEAFASQDVVKCRMKICYPGINSSAILNCYQEHVAKISILKLERAITFETSQSDGIEVKPNTKLLSFGEI